MRISAIIYDCMLRIRLRRVGRKHDPSYQLIVAEKGRGPQTGDYVEKVGTYDARSDEYELKGERIEYWMSEGAQPTDTVHNLLVKAGIVEDETVNPLPKKSPVTSGEPESEDGESEEGSAEDEEEVGGEAAKESSDEATETSEEPAEDADGEDGEEASDSEEEAEDEEAESDEGETDDEGGEGGKEDEDEDDNDEPESDDDDADDED
jgi:small subunit ribosomal protein S16